MNRSDPAITGSRPAFTHTLFWVLPAVLAFVAGLCAIDAGFIMDDSLAITMNPVVTEDLPIAEAFKRDFCGTPLSEPKRVLVWRPLLPLLWKIAWNLGEGSVLPFRIVTLVLHISATILVLFVGTNLISNKTLVFITGVLFSVHPLHVEALGSIVSQADILATILGLIAVWLILSPGSALRYVLSAVVLGCAFLAKEIAVIYGAIIVTLPWVERTRSIKDRIFISSTALLVVGGFTIFQILLERGGRNPINNLAYCASGIERTLHGLYIIGRSITMSFFPVGLAPSHDYAAIDLSYPALLPYAAFALGALVVLCALFFRAIEKRSSAWAIGIGLLVGPAFVQSSLLVCVNTELAERLLYPSTIASSALIGTLLCFLFKRRCLRWTTVSLLTVAFLYQSCFVQRHWKDNTTLFRYSLEVEPLSWRVHNNYGACLMMEGDHKQALWHYMVAAYILNHRPHPVDASPITELESLPIDQRLVEAPARFYPEDPQQYISFFFSHLIFLFNFPQGIPILAPSYEKRYGLK